MKQVHKLTPYRSRVGNQMCIAVLSIYDRTEFIASSVELGVYTKVTTWTKFHEQFEETKLDFEKTYSALKKYAEKKGASERALVLLDQIDPARQPEGEVEMAAKKPAAKPVAKAAAKPAPAAKAAAKVVEKTEAPAKRGRKGAFDGSAKIKILVKDNPKRAGAAKRYDLYKDGMTVDEYIAAGGFLADVRWDSKQQFIELK